MTAIELNAKKAELVKFILNDINSEELLEKIQNYIKKIKTSTPPCQFSVEELRQQIKQGEGDADEGLGISHDDMRKRYMHED